jgi:ammonia channel protein AmtB
MLWFGWLFFNAGSELAINGRAAIALFNTMLAGGVGALLWVFIDLVLLQKISGLSFCSGCVAGLACITPAGGTEWQEAGSTGKLPKIVDSFQGNGSQHFLVWPVLNGLSYLTPMNREP